MTSPPSDRLSIVSVVHGDPWFWEQNVALTAALNPRADYRWIVVDNSEPPVVRQPEEARLRVVAGVPSPRAGDWGSMHHAMGLERGLEQVDTRYLLLLDHDFFVIREGWVASILAHMREHELTFFGSVWHPRWFYQYRSFPSVHFMLVDTERIDRRDLELRPEMDGDAWWRFINDDRVPLPGLLRDTCKSQRIRDVGWRVCRRYRDSGRHETLTPHYLRPSEGRARWEKRLWRVLPRCWLKFPAAGDDHTDSSFLQESLPEAYRLQWEEFFWRDQPFAVHLRRVGRAGSNVDSTRDRQLLEVLLERCVAGGFPS